VERRGQARSDVHAIRDQLRRLGFDVRSADVPCPGERAVAVPPGLAELGPACFVGSGADAEGDRHALRLGARLASDGQAVIGLDPAGVSVFRGSACLRLHPNRPLWIGRLLDASDGAAAEQIAAISGCPVLSLPPAGPSVGFPLLALPGGGALWDPTAFAPQAARLLADLFHPLIPSAPGDPGPESGLCLSDIVLLPSESAVATPGIRVRCPAPLSAFLLPTWARATES
jgi:hypothetical protein